MKNSAFSQVKLLLFVFVTAISIAVFNQIALSQPTAIVGGTVFTAPHQTPIGNGVVIVDEGKIIVVGLMEETLIPPDAEIIDATGQFVLAGFWNSHVHYMGPLQDAAQGDAAVLATLLSDTFLRWGFVNTVDTGSFLADTFKTRDRIDSGEVAGPRIITTGGGFVPLGGSPYYIEPIKLPEFDTAENARNMVLEQLGNGADAVKLMTGSWATKDTVIVMDADLVRAATDAAHEKGVLVISHPSDSDGARVAIENGVDILAHTFPSELKGPWDQSLPGKMADRGVSLIPTLKLFRPELTGAGLPPFVVDLVEKLAIEQTMAIHQAGAAVLFGTDVGYMEDPDTTEEYRLLGLAGLDYNDILASLTTSPAARFGYAESSGRVEVGLDADLVILGADPRQDVTNYADVAITIRGGRIVFQR